ncbi:cytochrome c [Hyphomicrobium sp.]|uniref:c-type cytochrome n=1 Tax=Hyphomicrobium sp. TaxID=82 RepID=UPI0022CCA6D1|nr:cytochrome c [Hyphomicrobium sp.]MCZ7595452.1 cytochrome c [Hyphomicrobium sp.]
MSRLLQYLAVAFALLPVGASAVELGDKDAGHAYAQKVCADCHAVEKDTNFLFTDIPSFQEVADSQGMSPRALAVWLQTSHPNMPDFIIPPDDMDNVIAYIMSLRTPKE